MLTHYIQKFLALINDYAWQKVTDSNHKSQQKFHSSQPSYIYIKEREEDEEEEEEEEEEERKKERKGKRKKKGKKRKKKKERKKERKKKLCVKYWF